MEALGWNQYGGWRIGIRSDDRLRYYYYAHLRKDNPYAPGLAEGQHVSAGDVLGTIINALSGEPVETVTASESGLVFSQRRYAAVYPGTLIARLCRKERA